MTMNTKRMIVTEAEEFIANPPAGFQVERHDSGILVHSDEDQLLVLIDDFKSSRGKVTFDNSMGSKVKVHDLWQYTFMRKTLVSKKIYMMASLCEEKKKDVVVKKHKKEDKHYKVLKRYVLCIDGNDPYIKWQVEKGLDWTIATVAGESYRLEIDLTDEIQSWAQKNIQVRPTGKNTKLEWRGTVITLKYYANALFDLPHWLGCSKREFKLLLT
ncbi:uncharacterized protein medag [Genypterus blacodes]|uniref:uncharacterized protein medag n=1 Tax=Genypterus blacodes TaxID=154954 RepID=UPI003F76F987